MEEVLAQLQAAQQEIDPQFKALRNVMGALRTAVPLAAAEQADALPMQKALLKLEKAALDVESEELDTAVALFASVTQNALDNLAYEFAKDLREAFAERGETMEGRPPTLSVGWLTFKIDMAARKGQWFFGKEALTRPIPLSLTGILKAYDRQVKRVVERQIDVDKLLTELYQAWQDCREKRKSRPSRINIVETYSQVTLNRQTNRFWNAPSRSTFKDYERALFVRDLTRLRASGVNRLVVDGEERQLSLGVATKSQTEQASRSIWLPETAVDGQYYSDITFE